MKHKHYDVIVAWAEGKLIEKKVGDKWVELSGSPCWYEYVEYRIKPAKKQLWSRPYGREKLIFPYFYYLPNGVPLPDYNWVGPAVLVHEWEEE